MADESEEHADKKKALSFDIDWSGLKDQIVGLLATALKLICLVCALVLVLYIVFKIAGANPHNAIVKQITSWASNLELGFKNLFTPKSHNLKALLNGGAAAIFWVVVGVVGSAVIKKLGAILG